MCGGREGRVTDDRGSYLVPWMSRFGKEGNMVRNVHRNRKDY